MMDDALVQRINKFGFSLPYFESIEEAESYYKDYKQDHLEYLGFLIPKGLDFTIDSIKLLEREYFILIKTPETNKEKLELSMGVYFGELATRICTNARWVVQEYNQMPNRYELSIKKNLMTYVINNQFKNLDKKPNNARQQWLYREFKKLFL